MDESGNITNTLYRGINLIKDSQGNNYVYDNHGDVTSVIDGNGKVSGIEYDAFGAHMSITESDPNNPWQYCGEYRDEESGLIYLRNRYYDSDSGRFINEDTHWNVDNMIYGDKGYKENEIRYPDINSVYQSVNLYVYCIGNSVKYKDIDGKSALDSALSMVPKFSEADGPYPIGDAVAIIIVGGAIVIDGVTYATNKIDEALKKHEEKVKKEYEDAKENWTQAPKNKVKKQKDKKDNTGVDLEGEPYSSAKVYNSDGKLIKRRYYGADGKVEKDVDYGHQDNGTHTFPHEHNWDWSSGTPKRSH